MCMFSVLESGEGQASEWEDSVQLMTLHSAKGLEFPVVYLVGLEQGLFPHKRAVEEGSMEEERRLCYVGMTRARERLVMTRAATRIKRGKEVQRTASRFLQDIPEQLCDVVELAAIPVGPPTVKEQGFFASLRDKLKTEKEAVVPTGSGLDSPRPDR